MFPRLAECERTLFAGEVTTLALRNPSKRQRKGGSQKAVKIGPIFVKSLCISGRNALSSGGKDNRIRQA